MLGDQLRAGVLSAGLTQIGPLRGRGLSLRIPFVDADGQPSPALARKSAYRVWQLGAVVFYVGGNVLEVTPPLVLSDSELTLGIDLLVRAIGESELVSDAEVAPFAGW